MLSEKKENIVRLQQPFTEDEEDVIGNYLKIENMQETKREIYKFWMMRERERERDQGKVR